MPSWKGKGPISLQGSGKAAAQHSSQSHEECGPPLGDFALRIADTTTPCHSTLYATAHPDTMAACTAQHGDGGCMLELANGSDCVLPVRISSEAVPDCLHVPHVQRLNLHLAVGAMQRFRVYQLPHDESWDLVEIEIEVWQLGGSDDDEDPEVSAADVTRQIMQSCCGVMLCANQLVVIAIDGVEMVVRVATCDTADAHERDAALSYHCYRGRVTPSTAIFFADVMQDASNAAGAQSLLAGRRRVRLRGAKSRPMCDDARARAIVDVRCNDGEVFPVKRKLLRPCVKLTSAVRDEGVRSVEVNVDTLVFDRVLLFLEREATHAALPSFAVHLLDSLLQAAEELGCESLMRYVHERQGSMAARLRCYRLHDVIAANADGACWLMLCGMVLDVTRWLPEHPGGSTIIPQQALNIDCSRFFEVYHASRESFLYLKEFYIGEVVAEDVEDIQCNERASDEFLLQLQQYTPFRIPNTADVTPFVSF